MSPIYEVSDLTPDWKKGLFSTSRRDGRLFAQLHLVRHLTTTVLRNSLALRGVPKPYLTAAVAQLIPDDGVGTRPDLLVVFRSVCLVRAVRRASASFLQ